MRRSAAPGGANGAGSVTMAQVRPSGSVRSSRAGTTSSPGVAGWNGGADRGRAQAGAAGVVDLDGVQERGDRLGGLVDPSRAGADRDAGGLPDADQGAAWEAPHEAVLPGHVERVDPVAEVDDPAEQSGTSAWGGGLGWRGVRIPGWGGPGVLR